MINQQYPILSHIDSHIKPLLIGVLSADKLGVCYGTIEIDSISSSCGKQEGDRFRLSIPYARQNLTWNVLFDSQCPEMGPDFIFNDNTFLADMDIDTLSIEVPSLTKWNPNNKNALLNVLIELLSCYKQHQMQLLHKQERLKLEYNTLVKSTELKLEDVEMILLPYGSKPTEARFLISLSVDLSQLETRTCESKSDTAMLLIIFSGTDWNRIVPQLYLSRSLEEIFGGPTLNLPHFPSHKFLIDYVSEVKKCITEKINSIIQSREQRRDYISMFLILNHPFVLEYDSVNYTYITALSCVNNFRFILRAELLPGFPREKPVVTLTSVYHMKGPRTPYYEVIENYPYNLLWPPFSMITNLTKYIAQNIEKFKLNPKQHPY